MISIVNYGTGNIKSVENALKYLGIKYCVTDSKEQILSSDKLILPGVGAFNTAMRNLKKSGLSEALNKAVVELKIPILGICLGMQLLAEKGQEGGETDGLGFIQGEVKLLDTSLRLPHIGFNTADIVHKPNNIFRGLGEQADFYFVHSFAISCGHQDDVASYTEYGRRFVSAVQKGNVFGVQFHPEKSQSNGLLVLKNFVNFKKKELC